MTTPAADAVVLPAPLVDRDRCRELSTSSPADGVAISVVIPTYNRAELVERALHSVLAQTRLPQEIVVVDDGSTDRTREVLAAWAPTVKCVVQPNAGGAAARNHGVRVAAHGWIAFLDSDDVWTPDHLERLAEAVVATRGRAAYYFRDTERDPEEGGSTLWAAAGFRPAGCAEGNAGYELVEDGLDWAMLALQPMMLQASLFDRQRFLDRGGFDEELRRRHDTHVFLAVGVDHPICAVGGGCGVRFTADDASGQRLTRAHGSATPLFWHCTVRMYGDVLRRVGRSGKPNARAAARELRDRLAIAHWRLARLAMRSGRLHAVPLAVLRSLWYAPRVVLRAMATAVRGGRT